MSSIVFASTLLVGACTATDDAVSSSLDPTATTVTRDEPGSAATTSTTGTTGAPDPLGGTWLGSDPRDGMSVAVDLTATGDGYRVRRTEGHLHRCEAFGAPSPGVMEGSAVIEGGELVVTWETVTCETGHWGSVELPFGGARDTWTIEADRLGPCLTRTGDDACGEPQDPIPSAPAQVEAILETFGEEWFRSNYDGDPEFLLPLSAVERPACWPDPAEPAPDLSAWQLHAPPPLGSLPRDNVAGPERTTLIYDRGIDGATVLDQRQQVVNVYTGVGVPRANDQLVTFFWHFDVFYTRDVRSDAVRLPVEFAMPNWVREALPLGDAAVLVALGDRYVVYGLDGSLRWEWVHGGAAPLILSLERGGAGVVWAVTEAGDLHRVDVDEEAGVVVKLAQASAVAPLIPTEDGVWVPTSGRDIVFVGPDGDVERRVDVGPAPKGAGGHDAPLRQATCGGGFLWVSDGDGKGYRIPLDEGPAEVLTSPAVAVSEGVAWFVEDGYLVAKRLDTLEVIRRFDRYVVADEFTKPYAQWSGGALWFNGYVVRPDHV